MLILILILILMSIIPTFIGDSVPLLLHVQKASGPFLLWRPTTLSNFVGFLSISIQISGYTPNWDTTTSICLPYDSSLADNLSVRYCTAWTTDSVVKEKISSSSSNNNNNNNNNNNSASLSLSLWFLVVGNTLLYISRKTLQLVACSLLNLVILDRKFYKPDVVLFLCHFDFVLALLYGFSTFGCLKGVLRFVLV
jgi:hypothetical protein